MSELVIVWDAILHMLHETLTIPGAVAVLLLFGIWSMFGYTDTIETFRPEREESNQ